MLLLGICNFNNKYCGCQTYKEDKNNPEKCYYCNHYNAFHTGFSPPPQNISTPLLGACQKDGVSCGCQAFSANPNNELKCKYCYHYTAFHKNTAPSSVTSLINIENNLPSYLLSTSINNSGNSKFGDETIRIISTPSIKKKKRNQLKFNSPNTVASRGHPANVSLGLNHILLFTQGSWKNNSAPRENTSTWIEMRDNGFIIENVLFNENTAVAINALITRSFPSVNEYNWILLNGSASKLKAATLQHLHQKQKRIKIKMNILKLKAKALIDSKVHKYNFQVLKNSKHGFIVTLINIER
ncbi:hypothetical protein GLOIN_2v1769843 [Rhizophagus irregularis DAOM 181602=DAOM 197198]|nr:hypothetical protein GLOIN_2v1769843 [Rhizophagus irregularis DAOM 181602=DAOM 197198]